MLSDENTIKHAYNASFEWYCLNRAGYKTPIEQWRCTMAHGLYCGYTAGLEATGKAIGLPLDKQKLATGKALIRYFCVPCKPTRTNGNRVWNEPHHDMDKWKLFKEYCIGDVVAENAILKRLELFPMPESEERQWQMDVLMNAYGVKADKELIDGALAIDAESTDQLTKEAINLTGLANPNSTTQLLAWLSEKKVEAKDIQKATVAKLIDEVKDDRVKRVLEIRQQLGKTSVKKYEAMKESMGEGDRIRGCRSLRGGGLPRCGGGPRRRPAPAPRAVAHDPARRPGHRRGRN